MLAHSRSYGKCYFALGSRFPYIEEASKPRAFFEVQMKKVAILVDGGYYKKRAKTLFGEKNPADRADELVKYCMRHLKEKNVNIDTNLELYRIFYYDCKPSEKNVYHPLTQRVNCLKNSDIYNWNNQFFAELIKKRKVALRMGEVLESSVGYVIKNEITKKLCRGEISIADLKESDFNLDVQQKGVDMRVGLDIASLAYKKQVDRIVLIAGDSDFVPAAKHARREGIDFVLDPLWQQIKSSLMEHIDGLESKTNPNPTKDNEPLCVK